MGSNAESSGNINDIRRRSLEESENLHFITSQGFGKEKNYQKDLDLKKIKKKKTLNLKDNDWQKTR